MARPSKYKPEYPEQAAHLIKLGATEQEIADFFKVSLNTITNWKLRFPEFMGALKLAKEQADSRVEQSLYRRAMGYSHPDVHVSNYQGDVKLTPIVKVYPPDTVACIFWLKNRQPDRWRDKIDIEANFKPADVSSQPMQADEWDQRFGDSGRAN